MALLLFHLVYVCTKIAIPILLCFPQRLLQLLFFMKHVGLKYSQTHIQKYNYKNELKKAILPQKSIKTLKHSQILKIHFHEYFKMYFKQKIHFKIFKFLLFENFTNSCFHPIHQFFTSLLFLSCIYSHPF